LSRQFDTGHDGRRRSRIFAFGLPDHALSLLGRIILQGLPRDAEILRREEFARFGHINVALTPCLDPEELQLPYGGQAGGAPIFWRLSHEQMEEARVKVPHKWNLGGGAPAAPARAAEWPPDGAAEAVKVTAWPAAPHLLGPRPAVWRARRAGAPRWWARRGGATLCAAPLRRERRPPVARRRAPRRLPLCLRPNLSSPPSPPPATPPPPPPAAEGVTLLSPAGARAPPGLRPHACAVRARRAGGVGVEGTGGQVVAP
jgi:hypothetical protein